ncbi:MAG: GNAT family N-acetyltransferase [Alphaproteobacteria bacterium]|jgi:RimJ/RimL family protein N-acetyltransferase|nr:GNAT family N-acetyltransferase [Alphaproteobacteria bacterium]
MTTRLPVLSTERLTLRQSAPGDLEAILAMDGDAEVMRYISDGTVPEPEAHRAYVKTRFDEDFGPGLGTWSVFLRAAPDGFLGWVTIRPLPGWEPDIEISWRFARASWGRGYASEAAATLLRHGLETAGLHRIVAVVQAPNTASVRVAEKIGMRAAGRRKAWGAECLLFVADTEVSGLSRP